MFKNAGLGSMSVDGKPRLISRTGLGNMGLISKTQELPFEVPRRLIAPAKYAYRITDDDSEDESQPDKKDMMSIVLPALHQ